MKEKDLKKFTDFVDLMHMSTNAGIAPNSIPGYEDIMDKLLMSVDYAKEEKENIIKVAEGINKITNLSKQIISRKEI